MYKPTCKNGQHSLKSIARGGNEYDGYLIVKWCGECGAVVVDGEYDERVYPGKHMDMQFPKILTENLDLFSHKKDK